MRGRVAGRFPSVWATFVYVLGNVFRCYSFCWLVPEGLFELHRLMGTSAFGDVAGASGATRSGRSRERDLAFALRLNVHRQRGFAREFGRGWRRLFAVSFREPPFGLHRMVQAFALRLNAGASGAPRSGQTCGLAITLRVIVHRRRGVVCGLGRRGGGVRAAGG